MTWLCTEAWVCGRDTVAIGIVSWCLPRTLLGHSVFLCFFFLYLNIKYLLILFDTQQVLLLNRLRSISSPRKFLLLFL